MKLARLLGLAALLTGAFFSVFAADDDRVRYVEVRKQLVNVYVQLDPKSDIIRQARMGEYLELLSEGESWYKVKIEKDGVMRDGFMQARDGRVVANKGVSIIMILLYTVLLLGCAGGVVLYVRKTQSGASPGKSDDDLPDDDDDDA
jgi:hypothetical protein